MYTREELYSLKRTELWPIVKELGVDVKWTISQDAMAEAIWDYQEDGILDEVPTEEEVEVEDVIEEAPKPVIIDLRDLERGEEVEDVIEESPKPVIIDLRDEEPIMTIAKKKSEPSLPSLPPRLKHQNTVRRPATIPPPRGDKPRPGRKRGALPRWV